MKTKVIQRSPEETDSIIRMAWEDRCSFEQIEKRTGLTEPAVIRVMRKNLKPRSFKLWRARVSGRVTKHRKRFKDNPTHKGTFE